MKSNLIKAQNVWFHKQPRPMLIHFIVPVMDTFHNAEQKVEKLKEEIDELLAEVSMGNIDETAMMEELHDVLQVVAGYVLARLKDSVIPQDAYRTLPAYFEEMSIRHCEKMDQRAEERGWMVVHE